MKIALEQVRATCNVEARLELDPVAVVHRYPNVLDRELVGLMASAVAFGNVKALRAKLEQALARLGPDVALMADDEEATFARLRGWKHRVYRGEDLGRLLVGARRVQRSSGSLGRRFAEDFARERDLRAALAAFAQAVRQAGGLARSTRGRRGAAHILADPAGASGCKRLLLYLRWMIRPADGIDLGLWDIPPSALLVPVDTHIHKLSRNLGFTKRKNLSWKTTEEITAALREFDPQDPVKYDFALCHLGMLRRCPSRQDAVRCRGCGVMPVCRHWDSPKRSQESSRQTR
ncbi:MAG TPA: TIGR02757 family protein [Polyangiaceae bacterium]